MCDWREYIQERQWLNTPLLFDQDQDSLLVKRHNDNHSPGPVIRELMYMD